jgi:hypothetical protein
MSSPVQIDVGIAATAGRVSNPADMTRDGVRVADAIRDGVKAGPL